MKHESFEPKGSFFVLNENVQLGLGDCIEMMKQLPDNSVDSIVTDPPYGLKFMGKKWDCNVPSVAIWRECLRVLKPGGHLLAFAGTRTQHRMACNIEDAGFEIRDMIAWVYGCLDEQTEVATRDGIKPYHKAKIGDLVLCYNPDDGEYSYEPILEIVEYEYSDTAYRLVGDFGEQVVSRNHRVIVEQNGREAFQLAETLQREACVPFLESLPELQQAIYDIQQNASSAQQNMQQSLCKCADWESECRFDSSRESKGSNNKLCGLPQESLETRCVDQEGGNANLQSGMQRSIARCGVESSCKNGPQALDTTIRTSTKNANDWHNESSMERGINLSQSQGCICKSANQVCSMSSGFLTNGKERRICDGASTCCGDCDCTSVVKDRSSASHKSQCNRQQAGKLDAVCYECTAQGIRAWSGHKTAVVRVVPFHYTGKVWCLRVPTGSFVAVRNGVAFPTGNSGFPKSLNVSKVIEKKARGNRVITLINNLINNGMSLSEIGSKCGIPSIESSFNDWVSGGHSPDEKSWNRLLNGLGLDEEQGLDIISREIVSLGGGNSYTFRNGEKRNFEIKRIKPKCQDSEKWQGFGTALKPALEPITLARKPFKGTVAQNVLEHGTGAINIDGCRVPTDDLKGKVYNNSGNNLSFGGTYGKGAVQGNDIGRFPANLIHDGSDEVLACFPYTHGSGGSNTRKNKNFTPDQKIEMFEGGWKELQNGVQYANGGNASRFFYCAKASKKDRGNDNGHPTVKPHELMKYLCRLITPPNGAVLDPFMGSGSTGKAAIVEGFKFIGIEREQEYFEIAKGRIQSVCN